MPARLPVDLLRRLSGPWRRREPLPRRPLVVLAAVIVAGAAAGMSSAVPAAGWWWIAVVTLLLRLVRGGSCRPLSGCSSTAGRLPTARGASIVLVWASLAAAAAAWSAARLDLFAADDLAWRLGERMRPCIVRGTVVEPARPVAGADGGPPTASCVVVVTAVRGQAGWERVSGRARVIVAGAEAAAVPGGHVEVRGRGGWEHATANPGGFDRRAAARAARCLSVIRTTAAGIRSLGPPWWSLVDLAAAVRRWGEQTLVEHVGRRDAPLAASLLIGGRSGLDAETAHRFLVTGTVHVLSISGLHVGLLAGGIVRLLRIAPLPRWAVCSAVVTITAAYMLVTGADVPVVRATLVVWCGAIACATSRAAAAANALAMAAIVVIVCDPAAVAETGTQLSFLSTIVLVLAARRMAGDRRPDDPIDRLIERSRPPWEKVARGSARALAVVAIVNLAVWVATAPLVAWRFHLVSPVGLVLNLAVAPLVSLAMASGFLCLVTAPVAATIAGWCGGLCRATLAALDAAITLGAAVPGGHWWVAGPAAWWVAGWYLLAAGLLVGLHRDRLRRASTWAAAAVAWCLIGWIATAVCGPLPPPALRATVAAVGHGCGILVHGPGGGVLVYDAGRLGAAGGAGRTLAELLWSEGCARIDAIILSHPDADHVNGVPVLAERFAIGTVFVPPAVVAAPGRVVRGVLADLRRRGIAVRTLAAGAAVPLDPLCRLRVLHPASAGPPFGRDNEESLVVAVESAGRRLLLTGDLEAAALRRFVERGPDACDVLVAPHHGARTSLPPDIARATSPAYVLVSGAAGDAWPAVRAAYEAVVGRGRVLATGADGALRVTLSAAAVTAERFAAGRWRSVRPSPGPAG